jgi:hypothetical protein
MATTPAPAAPGQASIGAFGRLAGVLFNPRPTFEDIARKPSWIVPVVAIILVQLAVIAIFTQRVGWQSFFERQAATNSRIQQMPADQRQNMINQQVKYGPILSYVFVPATFVVATLAIAGLLLGLFNAMASAELDFKTSLGIVSHAFMPSVVGGLLGIVILFLKDPTTVDLQNLVASNLGAVLPDNASKWLVSLGSSFDIFSFWTIFLLGLGYSVARPRKIKMGTALTYVIVLWALYVVVKVGAAAIFS